MNGVTIWYVIISSTMKVQIFDYLQQLESHVECKHIQTKKL